MEIPLLNNIKGLWEEFMMYHDKVMWQNSPERRELAVKRITQLRAYMNQPYGGTIKNPYADLMED